jgi:predicted  nucleic acid-binding Zn-ribbon protein
MTTVFLKKLFFISTAALLTWGATGCSRALTKADIQDDLEDAREAAREAQEEAQKAIADRQQFYADYKLTQVRTYEDRIKQIDKRIDDLKKTAKKSENTAAVNDMKSAIEELEKEKKDINRSINRVQGLQERDWTQSSEAINAAVQQIEAELDKLSQSLAGYEEADR